jgi:galactokinase
MSPSTDFAALFGAPPRVRAFAPGRVNLIGEHTDYQDGFVLPITIPQGTTVELSPRADVEARVWSANTSGSGPPARFVVGEETVTHAWYDYVQGVTVAVRAAGHRIGGFDARIESTVPVGSGLSSSAALEVALLRALREAFTLPLDDLGIALCAHRAETEFVGAPVGLMDQMACSLGGPASALFIDTRARTWDKVPLPDRLRLVVIDSGVPHSHATGEYRTRRAEAEAAARALGVPMLRDLGPEDLPRIDGLAEPLRRRARHIVTENARVVAAVEALRAGQDERLGRLLYESHESLRRDYEVTVPELDTLVDLARDFGVYVGARMTGGGFGGAVILLAPERTPPGAEAALTEAYARRTGRTATVLVGG